MVLKHIVGFLVLVIRLTPRHWLSAGCGSDPVWRAVDTVSDVVLPAMCHVSHRVDSLENRNQAEGSTSSSASRTAFWPSLHNQQCSFQYYLLHHPWGAVWLPGRSRSCWGWWMKSCICRRPCGAMWGSSHFLSWIRILGWCQTQMRWTLLFLFS